MIPAPCGQPFAVPGGGDRLPAGSSSRPGSDSFGPDRCGQRDAAACRPVQLQAISASSAACSGSRITSAHYGTDGNSSGRCSM